MDAINKYVPTEEEVREARKEFEQLGCEYISEMPDGKNKTILEAYWNNIDKEEKVNTLNQFTEELFGCVDGLKEGNCQYCPFFWIDKYGFCGCKIDCMEDNGCILATSDEFKEVIEELAANDKEQEFNKKYDQMKQVLIDQINRKEQEIALNKNALEKACHKLGFSYVKGKNCDIAGTECKADKECEVCLKEHFLAQAEVPDGKQDL